MVGLVPSKAQEYYQMANEEHVSIVLSGSEAIAEWRTNNPNEILDLSRADLRRADFQKANLNGADLGEANLEWADFRWADLIGAKLNESTLSRADFHKADLMYANLSRAKIFDTNFEDANLQGADFSEATIADARLLNTDLRGVKGLDSTVPLGPSVIDTETLSKAGYLPSTFLRGCGLSEVAIKASYANDSRTVREELETGGEYYSCFISYSSNDFAFANQLFNDLQSNGVRCWFDKKDMKIGDAIQDTIFSAIRKHEKLLLILSEQSVTSNWVEDEVHRAFQEERDRNEFISVYYD